MTKPQGLIRIQYPTGAPSEFAIRQEVVSIGRNTDNQLVLKHKSVSRMHARLYCLGRRVYLEDLGSTSGTYIEGRRLPPNQPTRLRKGQSAHLGAVELSLSSIEFKWQTLGIALAAGSLILGVLCLVAAGLYWWLRPSRTPPETVCNEPVMVVLKVGGKTLRGYGGAAPVAPGITAPSTSPASEATQTSEPGSPVATTEVAQPILSTAFLELPFPYDGGNENFGGTLEQFRKASQIYSRGGRINSYFDHLLPLYPLSFNGKEPQQFGGKLLIFDGNLRADVDYSGHPGYDFKTFEHRQPTTPVFAAADGIVDQVGVHGASGALFVRIVHEVAEVGSFRTTYWHLHPDEHFEAMKGREGEPIAAGTRIGTMGNTGFSTGHHLHFEVRFDRNGDGRFAEGERVDPYGFIPSAEYPLDPWVERSAPASEYLWVHPLGLVAEIPPSGGGSLDPSEGIGGEIDLGLETSLCAPADSLPAGGTLYVSWAPDPAASEVLMGVGKSSVISVFDREGVPARAFDPPLRVVMPFEEADLADVDESTLRIYWVDPASNAMMALPTRLDLEAGIASADASRPGKYALMGLPTRDVIPPKTAIQVSGEQSPGGVWYEQVTVELESSDPSEILKIEYSLDSGVTWQTYQGPFTIDPNGIPEPDYVMDEEFFGLGPGRFLVMAAAIDGAGNVEDPPAFRGILIDPSQKVATPTATYTTTVTSPTCASELRVETSANCRQGPGPSYGIQKKLPAGVTLSLLGQNEDAEVKWWLAALPDSSDSCWISGDLVSIEGDTNPQCVPQIEAPPTPTGTIEPQATKTTPAPAPNSPPPAPTTYKPLEGSALDCVASVALRWSEVSDSDGISVYQWELQRSDDPNGPFAPDNSGQSNDTNAFINVDCQTWYRWRVRAVDGKGLAGDFSDWSSFSIKP